MTIKTAFASTLIAAALTLATVSPSSAIIIVSGKVYATHISPHGGYGGKVSLNPQPLPPRYLGR